MNVPCQRADKVGLAAPGAGHAGRVGRDYDLIVIGGAAATVRGLADGNETIPTVVIGGHGYVNPSAATVLAEVRRISPGFTPNLVRTGRRLRLLRVIQWVLIAALIAASFVVEAAGHAALSWGLDGVAVAVYLIFRLATAAALTRRRSRSFSSSGPMQAAQ